MNCKKKKKNHKKANGKKRKKKCHKGKSEYLPMLKLCLRSPYYILLTCAHTSIKLPKYIALLCWLPIVIFY